MTETKKPEPIATDTTKDEFVYKRDHAKSLRQISRESSERLNKVKDTLLEKSQEDEKSTKDTKTNEEGIVDAKSETGTEPKIGSKMEPKIEAPVVNQEEIAKKAAEEAKIVAAQVAKDSFQNEMQKILDQNKSLEDKQKEADELISIWDKEKRLPTTYKEIVDETLRISEAKYKQLQRQEQEKKVKEETDRKESELKNQTETQRVQQLQIEEINKKVTTDLNDLYENKHLRKPPEKYDPDNDIQKETDELIKFGIQLNTERSKRGIAPVDSLAKIYFMYYKPTKDSMPGKTVDQLPGADAPISGAKTPASKELNTKGYVYVRDHQKTYRQILLENFNRLKNK